MELADGSYALCPEQDEEQFFEGTKRSLLPVSKSTVHNTRSEGQFLNREKPVHTSEVLRRCADRNGAIPQVIVVVGQQVATSVPLARRFDATSKGVWTTGIPLIGGHTSLYLSGRELLV